MINKFVQQLRSVGRDYDFHENAFIYKAADMIESQAREIELLKYDNELLRNLSFRDERDQLRKDLAEQQKLLEHWKIQHKSLAEYANLKLTEREAEVIKLREILKNQNFWVEGVLQCKEWIWDGDQREAAEECLSYSKEALSTPQSSSYLERWIKDNFKVAGWTDETGYVWPNDDKHIKSDTPLYERKGNKMSELGSDDTFTEGFNSAFSYRDAEIASLKALSVTNILIDIVPGDGSGQEVYAKSVADVVGLISRLSEKAEDSDSLKAQLAECKKDSFQERVRSWMIECFGLTISCDRVERNHRFLEESLELVQSLGCTQTEAHQLVDYVYGRPDGEPYQEVGGVMTTLAALCLANQLDMSANGETELARIWAKVEQIRAKQAAKPKYSPLPQG